MSHGDYTHQVTYKDGSTFFAKVVASRMYVSQVILPNGKPDTMYKPDDYYVDNYVSPEEYFTGDWICKKLNQFKGNK